MIGKNIKDVRLAHNLSQTEFAAQVGSDQTTISLIENGHMQPSVLLIEAVAEEFHVSYDLLFKKSETESEQGFLAANPEFLDMIIRHIDSILQMEEIDDKTFALRCSISYKRLTNIFNGISTLAAEDVFNILVAFPEYSADWFLLDKGDMKVDTDKKMMQEVIRHNKELIGLMQKNIKKSGIFTPKKN